MYKKIRILLSVLLICMLLVPVSALAEAKYTSESKVQKSLKEPVIKEPEILTVTLPKATVGKLYSFRLKSADPDAVFFEYYNPGKPNDLAKTGLCLTQRGELKGTPKEAGEYTFTLMASGAGGESYLTFTLTVEEAETVAEPEIQTASLPNATVGKEYYCKLECTDPDAVFAEYYNPGKANDLAKTGLYITQHGELEGTPKEVGEYTFTLMVSGEGGEGNKTFTITVEEAETSKPAAEPEIKTTSLPKATVGKEYYCKLKCTDPDAVFSEYYNPGKANDLGKTGLYVTQHGELEGTPKKAGKYTFTLMASGEGGEGYMTFTLTVEEAVEESKTEDNITFIEDPEKSETDIQSEPLPETSEKIDSEVSDMVTTVGPLPETGVDAEEESGGMPWWAIALIAVAAAGIGMGVTLLLLKYKKK